MTTRTLTRLGPRFLPFADVASETMPLGRLLRLSLFQITVGMALVLLVGTLNRVMIVELAVPASLVAVMIALPMLAAPLRALIGFRSDTHVSALGWRRVPFIWRGTLLQFGGFAVMPFALLVLSGHGEAAHAPVWIGYASAAIAFLLVGTGVHMVQTIGLALATDLVRPEDQARVVGLMFTMLLIGMMVSAVIFGALLEAYSPGRLIRVVQGAAVVTVILNVVAIWKQEPRDRRRAMAPPDQQSFGEALTSFVAAPRAVRRLLVIGLGTMGFGMADVVLEPFGGQALGMSVAETTRLTAIMAIGGLTGFALASRVLSRGVAPLQMAGLGLITGIPAFGAIMAAPAAGTAGSLVAGTLVLGLGAGLFGHGTLSATMRAAPPDKAGLALGAWGAVQATAAGIAIALGGLMRDAILTLSGNGAVDPAAAYLPVFALEILFLAIGAILLGPAMGGLFRRHENTTSGKIGRDA
ncbi:MAG: PucC family protein [Pseudomonadota bacterium]